MNEFPLRVFIKRENFLIIYRINNKKTEKNLFFIHADKGKEGGKG